MTGAWVNLLMAVIVVAERLMASAAGNFDFGIFHRDDDGADARTKRSVLFLSHSVLQMTIGVVVEEENIERNVAGVALALQHNANLPDNAYPEIVTGREFSIYDNLKEVITRYGFNGLECLQKMICQIAEIPLEGEIMEEIVNFVLTPSKHRYIKNDSLWKSLLESERLGKGGTNCSLKYCGCDKTPLDMFSYLNLA